MTWRLQVFGCACPRALALKRRVRRAVADFGVARRLSSCSESMTAETGTYRWMAPEVIRHSRYDHRVDLYSFAIVLWEMLSGKLPYGELSPIAAAAAVVVENLRPPLGDVPPGTPAALTELMVVCWDVAPAVRPEFEGVAADLKRLRLLEEEAAAARAAAGEGSGHGRLSGVIAGGSPAGAGEGGGRDTPLRRQSADLRPLSQLEPDAPLGDGEVVLQGSVADEAGHVPPFPRSAPPQRRRTGGILEMLGCCSTPAIAGNSL